MGVAPAGLGLSSGCSCYRPAFQLCRGVCQPDGFMSPCLQGLRGVTGTRSGLETRCMGLFVCYFEVPPDFQVLIHTRATGRCFISLNFRLVKELHNSHTKQKLLKREDKLPNKGSVESNDVMARLEHLRDQLNRQQMKPPLRDVADKRGGAPPNVSVVGHGLAAPVGS
ncbi:hypothetical protein NDU88_006723 [Pleurodeles waltl]|uniref:Uncharacterized protein n=1 Tax=Pleurodeles waltl TaxID=8319 RepID=A0AAV7TYK7_PLEWA|nr:hypothetical protein NDU88_006723 [Pleurodeles waltl]